MTTTTPLTKDSRNAIGMPMIGFGTYQMSNEQAEASVLLALKAGFRHIDSAQGYNNEEGTGRALAAFFSDDNNTREDVFVTTKLWPGYTGWGMPEQGYDDTIATCKKQLEQLQLTYIDLYLIHSPTSSTRVEQWRAIVELQKMGLVKHIGVSNYNKARLQEIEDAGLPMPQVNEIEFHPLMQQPEMTQLMQEKKIVPVAYSSLATMSSWRKEKGQGGDVKADLKADAQAVQAAIAKELEVPEAAVLLRWGMQRGYAVLTKSTNEDRIKSNLDVFGFELTEEHMNKMNALNKNEYLAWAANGMNPMEVEVPLAKKD
ncbi:keto reductase family 1 member C1 homolog [Seminavis robusta]|uniref:Keto reductase family 1 member C1 homolog n=1 Tax=Seminavis robusta TaxID=568900 RepID=A0A9N8DSK5_9STRA|nr:keto reductase family 1 member C1 homolog [Seminavis robusta]|eukprot:Sro249_g098620.1 keto reductase family 1 member C1 homolog (315) ;mRNA; r:22490-23434